MLKQLCRCPSVLFLIDKALLDEVLRCGRELGWNVRQLSLFQLLDQMVQVSDAVPWVLCRC